MENKEENVTFNFTSEEDENEDTDIYIFEEDNQEEIVSNVKSKVSVIDKENIDSKKAKPVKKRTKKLKRFSESKTAFDGSKVVFTTDFTQTDWDWINDVLNSGKAKILISRYEVLTPLSRSQSGVRSIDGKTDSRQTSGKTRSERESILEDRTITDLTPFSLQPNDEFGIPLTDVSSDSDSESSDTETPKKTKTSKRNLPLVGPPLILKYIRESDLAEVEASKTNQDGEVDQSAGPDDQDQANYVIDEYGNAVGMLSGLCEFCGSAIKPFPSLEQQLSEPPEALYCCEDYRDFVEFAMTTANRLEEDANKRNDKINVKVHHHFGSKEARILAKEKAVQRMHERELQRRRQEASGLHASYQYSYIPQEDETDTAEYHKPSEAEAKKQPKKETGAAKGVGGDKGAGAGDKPKQKGGSVDLESIGGHSSHRHVPAPHPPNALGSVGGYGAFNPEVARQMKTINYQLSSQRCLEEGWTLRAPSPLNLDDPDNETFVPEPLHPAMLATGKVQGRELIRKFYPNGSPFLTLFPDGTGNVFYPSGRIAILITNVSIGQNTYILLDDTLDPHMLAVFEANGCGTCNFANGKIRLNYDPQGGIELDVNGARRKSWSWKDHETHVHAPPFQPIVFGMNYFLGIRFMTQESIALTLTGKNRSCRFNVGARLKGASPENFQNKVNEYQLYIEERRVRIESVMNKVSNLLKFPKSQKLDTMLPPLSLTSRQQKVDKKRQQFTSSSPRAKDKKVTKQHRLPPLDHPAVSVSVN